MKCRRKMAGFTLVEVLLVLAILGVITSMVVPRLVGRQKQANIDATSLSIKGIEQSLKLYALDHGGEYPSTQDGLSALVQSPQGNRASSWRGPYLESLPTDAWGNTFHYASPGQMNTNGVDLVSPGPDGALNTNDDVTNHRSGM
jgi:general secretion pathway protein G